MRCVEQSRKVTITVTPQDNGTLEFAIAVREDSTEDGTHGAKYDIERQVCLVSNRIAAATAH